MSKERFLLHGPPTISRRMPIANTFGVPALAQQWLCVYCAGELLQWLKHIPPQPLILGAASNVLFVEQRPPFVLKIALHSKKVVMREPPFVIVEAAAGEPWHAFVMWTLQHGFYGLENLAFIPGTVGAGPLQNIGAYGVELSDRFESLDAISLNDGSTKTFNKAACRFGYRHSLFKERAYAHWLVTAVRFRLHLHVDRLESGYGAIQAALAASGISAPNPLDIAKAIYHIRAARLPDPKKLGNAGSFFKNPIVGQDLAETLHQHYPQLVSHLTLQPLPDHQRAVKLSAGWLIEQCGWKGFREGDAGVAEQHALVLVNYGKATGQQIWHLAERIRRSVYERFGVLLEPEARIII